MRLQSGIKYEKSYKRQTNRATMTSVLWIPLYLKIGNSFVIRQPVTGCRYYLVSCGVSKNKTQLYQKLKIVCDRSLNGEIFSLIHTRSSFFSKGYLWHFGQTNYQIRSPIENAQITVLLITLSDLILTQKTTESLLSENCWLFIGIFLLTISRNALFQWRVLRVTQDVNMMVLFCFLIGRTVLSENVVVDLSWLFSVVLCHGGM